MIKPDSVDIATLSVIDYRAHATIHEWGSLRIVSILLFSRNEFWNDLKYYPFSFVILKRS